MEQQFKLQEIKFYNETVDQKSNVDMLNQSIINIQEKIERVIK